MHITHSFKTRISLTVVLRKWNRNIYKLGMYNDSLVSPFDNFHTKFLIRVKRTAVETTIKLKQAAMDGKIPGDLELWVGYSAVNLNAVFKF